MENKTIGQFKKELDRLIKDFNKSNDCIIQEIDLKTNAYADINGSIISYDYNIALKIK